MIYLNGNIADVSSLTLDSGGGSTVSADAIFNAVGTSSFKAFWSIPRQCDTLKVSTEASYYGSFPYLEFLNGKYFGYKAIPSLNSGIDELNEHLRSPLTKIDQSKLFGQLWKGKVRLYLPHSGYYKINAPDGYYDSDAFHIINTAWMGEYSVWSYASDLQFDTETSDSFTWNLEHIDVNPAKTASKTTTVTFRYYDTSSSSYVSWSSSATIYGYNRCIFVRPTDTRWKDLTTKYSVSAKYSTDTYVEFPDSYLSIYASKY